MKLFFPFFTLIFIPVFGMGQAVNADTIKYKYDKQAIRIEGNKFFMENSRLSISQLKSELNLWPGAKQEFNQYLKKKNTAFVFASFGLAANITAIFTSNTNRNLATGLLVGGLLTNVISVRIRLSSKEHLDKAIWQRNRDILLSN